MRCARADKNEVSSCPGSRQEYAVRVKKLMSDAGSATAEYAIATMAAVGFAGLLVVIMRSDEVRGILTGLVRDALNYGG